MQCCISWIDSNGTPTSDTNEAIGNVELEAYIFHNPILGALDCGPAGPYPICAEHAKRLADPGMEHWSVTLFAEDLPPSDGIPCTIDDESTDSTEPVACPCCGRIWP